MHLRKHFLLHFCLDFASQPTTMVKMAFLFEGAFLYCQLNLIVENDQKFIDL